MKAPLRATNLILSPHAQVEFTLPAVAVAGLPAGVDILLDASNSVNGESGSGFDGDGLSVINSIAAARSLTVAISDATDLASDL